MVPAMDVPDDVRRLASELASPRPMRAGSLTQRRVKCSKPGCRCGDRDEARHGPYWSLTQAIDGKTSTRLVPPPQADLVREQLEAGRRFREQVDEYRRACQRWADAELTRPAAPPGDAEKGGSRPASRPRSRKKSKR